MNPKEFRNLQEAYLEVVEGQQLDEAGRLHTASAQQAGWAAADANRGARKVRSDDEIKKEKGGQEFLDRIAAAKKKMKEQVDIYDIILSHLIDEGYAETPEAAEAIMVNMSEEWRDSIVEEMLDEGKKEFPFDKVHQKAAKHEGDEIKTRSYKSGLRARKMKAIASTVDAGGDPRNTWGQDLRKIGR